MAADIQDITARRLGELIAGSGDRACGRADHHIGSYQVPGQGCGTTVKSVES